MRTKARAYLHYAPVAGGVYISGARSQLVMRGPELLFRLVDVCLPLLESGATEDELVAALGSERARPVVRHLVSTLGEHGMLLALASLTVAQPPPDVRERYAGSIAYLESLCDDPYAMFAKLRAAKVGLIGPPEVVQPAARGLLRAGVGQVVVLGSAADDGAYADLDAAIWCCGVDTGSGPHVSLPLPAGVPVVPVLLDDLVLLAGPAVTDDRGYRAWSAFRDRALDWARADGLEPAARPVADALVGALAGQLLFKVFTAIAADGAAQVVFGAELRADEVTVLGAAGHQDDGWRLLENVLPAELPERIAAVDLAATLKNRWTGLFTPGSAEEDLPQLPLALRQIEHRTGRTGSVFVSASDQESATVGVALEALRQSCPDSGEAAAGLTEEHWLLDGALRLLTGDARGLDKVAPDDLDPEAARIWRMLVVQDADPPTIQLLHVPGLDWRLGQVASATGRILGRAWAPEADRALRDALGSALAANQVHHVRADRPHVTALRTDALVFADEPTVSSLRKQVAAHATAKSVAYRGRSSRFDPVLGDIPFWFGPVAASQLEQEPSDAH